jgi:nicotinamidase-related amidase
VTQPAGQFGRGDDGAAPPWLVVIDMQNVFGSPESPWFAPGFDEILDNNRALIEAFGDRVVYTRFIAPETPQGAWRDYYAEWAFALVPPDAPLYDLVESLPHAGQPVVSRVTFGKWDDDAGSLRELTHNAGTLVVCGVSTDCCVLSTALAAADAGVFVQIVADACAGVSRADHERALDTMRLYAPLITVTSTEDVLRTQ